MWRTSEGERTLVGAEAALMREALGTLVDHVRDDDDGTLWQLGVAPFDSLPRGQKLAVLARVGDALLREDFPPPKVSAVSEGAVAAIYEHLRSMVEMELEGSVDDEEPTWRQLILHACRECGMREEMPDQNCEDLEEWNLLIDCLMGGVLWDEDWQDGEHFLDAAPETSRGLKKLLGIDKDYYVDVPPDPSDEEVNQLLARLWKLTQGGE